MEPTAYGNGDHDAMLAIQELLDGTIWSTDTLEAIAAILVDAGYPIRDADDRHLATLPQN